MTDVDTTLHRERGRPPGTHTRKYDGKVMATVPLDLRDQLVRQARQEGTTLATLVRRALYREHGYEERTA
ncbi:MAG TPA: hypothetical protein VK611_17095 [Acidimicrobiales bacterium]|nr:hypothetical protein [Acidimicrobiales bacterium]